MLKSELRAVELANVLKTFLASHFQITHSQHDTLQAKTNEKSVLINFLLC